MIWCAVESSVKNNFLQLLKNPQGTDKAAVSHFPLVTSTSSFFETVFFHYASQLDLRIFHCFNDAIVQCVFLNLSGFQIIKDCIIKWRV
jgi:hypothetical protein